MFAAFCLLGAAVCAAESPKAQGEYLAKLIAAEPTAEAQFRLATWARRQGLREIADGHLRAAVNLDPQHVGAQKALGRTLQAGVWETKDERKNRLAEETKLREDRAAWSRRLAEHGVETATAERVIDEAAASAMEDYSATSERRSMDCIKALRRSNRAAATMGLARQALASRFPKVRQAAAEALRDRNPEHYLLTLVDFLRPQRVGTTVVLGVGEVWYWQEGVKMFVALPAPPTANSLVPQPRASKESARQPLLERSADAETARSHAVVALQIATGKKFGDDFSAWHKFAMANTDLFVESRAPKPTSVEATYYQPETIAVGSGIAPSSANFSEPIVAAPPATGNARISCFAAGTLVAAKRGTIPIDHVCLGELVLSQNVETGEVAYKPVLARTLRPRTEMRELSFAGETLTATLAHHFWLTDGGWTKAKDLRPGAALRTSDGEVALSSNAPGEPAQAYNLVVADFGTYFVGKAKVLVHDNSPIRDAAPARK
jgi:hypothetical protein